MDCGDRENELLVQLRKILYSIKDFILYTGNSLLQKVILTFDCNVLNFVNKTFVKFFLLYYKSTYIISVVYTDAKYLLFGPFQKKIADIYHIY
jgi:hypothetical protein